MPATNTPVVGRPARPRGRRGSRPSCGTPARRRAAVAGSARAGRARTTKSVSVADGRARRAGGPPRPPRRARRPPTASSALISSSPTPASRSAALVHDERVARLPLLDLLGRRGSARGRPRSGRASGRSRPRRRRARARRAPRATTSAIAAAVGHDVVAVDRRRRRRRSPRPAARAAPRAGSTPGRTRRSRCSRRRRPPAAATRPRGSRASWNAPWAGAPSPKNATATLPSARSCAAVAAPDRDRQAGGHDPVGAEDPERRVGDVHRAAAAAVRALRPCPSARRTSRAGRGPWPGSGRGRGGWR